MNQMLHNPMATPKPAVSSVASVFHGLRNSSLAPRPGRRMPPPPLRPAGAQLPISQTGRVMTPDGHIPTLVP